MVNTELIDDLDFATLMPDAPFTERDSRSIDRPIDEVWKAFLGLQGDEIRLLAPLFALRSLPARLKGRRGASPSGAGNALDLFAEEGFVMLRRDEHVENGRATLIFGTAGKFWSPAHNGPRPFDSAADFLDFDEPGNAKTVARFDVFERNGRTALETETLVEGTDPASTRKFAFYWAIIRGPSGLLRRSWLAAVERSATA